MYNPLYEFGNLADIIIKCNVPTTIGGIDYAANEPYTALSNIRFQFSYEENIRELTAKQRVVSHNASFPTSVTLNNIPFNKKICNLIMEAQDNQSYISTYKEEIICSESGKLLLSYPAITDNIFIYDRNFQHIEYIKSETNIELSGHFIINEQYIVFYERQNSGDIFNFDVPTYPYFTLELFTKGNTDKQTKKAYIKFNAASLTSTPNFQYEDGIMTVSLKFNLIYNNQQSPQLIFNG